MSLTPSYFIAWRGQRSGPFTLADIQRDLASGLISLSHQVDSGNETFTVRQLLDHHARSIPAEAPRSALPTVAETPQPRLDSLVGAPAVVKSVPPPPDFPPPAARSSIVDVSTSAPQVHITAINPGTAGFIAALCAALGFPFFGYIQTGRISRGIIVQLAYWFLGGFIVVFFYTIGSASFENTSDLGAGATMGLTSLASAVCWILAIIYTIADVNKLVKEHNAGRGVRYT